MPYAAWLRWAFVKPATNDHSRLRNPICCRAFHWQTTWDLSCAVTCSGSRRPTFPSRSTNVLQTRRDRVYPLRKALFQRRTFLSGRRVCCRTCDGKPPNHGSVAAQGQLRHPGPCAEKARREPSIAHATSAGMKRQVAVESAAGRSAQRSHIVKRFVREARARARSTIRTSRPFPHGWSDGRGAPFIVMEYIDGRPLSALLDLGKPLSQSRIVPWRVRLRRRSSKRIRKGSSIAI